jgi:hypothetical protein
MVETHTKHPEASMTYSDYHECNNALKSFNIFKGTPLKEGQTVLGKFDKANKYSGTNTLVSHFKVFKRTYYNLTQGLNPTLLKAVDRDLILKLEEVGKLIHVNDVLYCHRKHVNSISVLFHKKPTKYRDMISKAKHDMYWGAWVRRGKKSSVNLSPQEKI